MKNCFVVSPIGHEGSDTRKRSDQLLKHIIEPVCKEHDLKAIRVDNITSSDSITETIIDLLTNSDLVIADLTEHNPNAFFEIGFRTALKKPIIHLKSKDDTIPFDISTIRTFDYDLTDLDSVADIKVKLSQTISALNLNEEPLETSSLEEQNTNNNFNSSLLQEIFKIQDDIKALQKSVDNFKSVDSDTLSMLVDKIVDNSSKTSENVMMESFLNVALNDPAKIKNLLELSNQINSFNK